MLSLTCLPEPDLMLLRLPNAAAAAATNPAAVDFARGLVIW